MSYDAHGNVVLVTERDGATTVHEYDDRGRRTHTVTPSGADLTYGYDEHDRLDHRGRRGAARSPSTPTRRRTTASRHPAAIVDPEGGAHAAHLARRAADQGRRPGRRRGRLHPRRARRPGRHDGRRRRHRAPRARRRRPGRRRGHALRRPHDVRLRRGHRPARRAAATPTAPTWRYEHTAAGRLRRHGRPDRCPHRGRARRARRGDPHASTRWAAPSPAPRRPRQPRLGRAARRLHLALHPRRALPARPPPPTPDGATWTQEHDATGDVVATTDPTGRAPHPRPPTGQLGTARADDGLSSAATRFDRLGRLVATEQADGAESLVTYDRCGRAVEHVDADGCADHGCAATPPAGSSQVIRPLGRDHRLRVRPLRPPAPPSSTRPAARTTYAYDADGRLVEQTLPTGEVAWTEYDVVRPGHRPPPARLGDRPLHLRRRRARHAEQRHRGTADGRSATTPPASWSRPSTATAGVTRYAYDTHGRVATHHRPARRRDPARVRRAGTTSSPRPTRWAAPPGPRTTPPGARRRRPTPPAGRPRGRFDAVRSRGVGQRRRRRRLLDRAQPPRPPRWSSPTTPGPAGPPPSTCSSGTRAASWCAAPATAAPSRGSTTPTAAGPR